MEAMEIKPDNFTYNQLMINFRRKKDFDMVGKLYLESVNKHGIKPDKITYGELMNCYKNMNKPIEAE
jgi:pentatricopeptide repeat protein